MTPSLATASIILEFESDHLRQAYKHGDSVETDIEKKCDVSKIAEHFESERHYTSGNLLKQATDSLHDAMGLSFLRTGSTVLVSSQGV